MITFILQGGFPMWFLLIFGGISLGAGARFAYRPSRDRLPFLTAISFATGFTAVMGVLANLSLAAGLLSDRWDRFERPMGAVLLQAFSEAMAPGILGFGLLSLVGVLAAVGFFRDDMP